MQADLDSAVSGAAFQENDNYFIFFEGLLAWKESEELSKE